MALQQGKSGREERSFVVGADSFANLRPVRAGGDSSSFFALEDSVRDCRIRNFLLHTTEQRQVYCDVTLIRKSGEKYTPRLRFWIRDTSKKGIQIAEEKLDGVSEISHFAKASVDTAYCHTNLWTLLGWLREYRDFDTPDAAFRVVEDEKVQFLELLSQLGKTETVLDSIGKAFGSSLTDSDITRLTNRREQLEEFHSLLNDPEHFQAIESQAGDQGKEKVWQDFFERNKWIFGYGLQLVTADSVDNQKLERTTSGNDIFSGAGKRADFVMRSRGFVSTLLFGEIKHHETRLLDRRVYRGQDVWVPSLDLAGGVAQVQKTVEKAVRRMQPSIHRYELPDGTPTGIEFSSTRPRKVLLIGNLSQFDTKHGTNSEKLDTFELFRNSISDVEIVTFDELLQRARFIVDG